MGILKKLHVKMIKNFMEISILAQLRKNAMSGYDIITLIHEKFGILAFAVFGFDGLSLWHIFAADVKDEIIENYGNTVEELINGFKLPVFYLATKVLDEENLRLKCFKPWGTERSVDYYIDSLNSYWMRRENRNPLLADQKVKDRRKIVKTVFRIPA